MDVSESKNYIIHPEDKFRKKNNLKIGGEKITQGDFVPIYYVPEISPEEEGLIEELKGRIDGEVSIERVIDAMGDLTMPKEEKKRIAELVVNDVSGYGLLQPLLEDDDLEEIMVVGVNAPVYVYHRLHGMCESNLIFKDTAKIETIIDRIAKMSGRKVNTSHPLLDARLPDGSRVNATLSTISIAGPTITIRKFRAEPLTIVDLIKLGTLDANVASFLWFVVEGFGFRAGNILISGASGAGKSTLLNCLAIFIPARERVITIEDTVELQLPVKHKIALETKPPHTEGEDITADMLLKNALRMRPDRIIVNEVRGEEANTLFGAMNTGHDGCMCTIHANSARDTITRLTNLPMKVIPMMIPSLDLIIMQNTFNHAKGTVRRMTEIAEIGGTEGEKVLLNNIYEWNPRKDAMKSTGTPSVLKQKVASNMGCSGDTINAELEGRELFLEYLVRENISRQEDVYKWIQEYYRNPEKILDKIMRMCDL